MSKEDNDLILEAKEAVKSSYSPYSHFAVGAAVRLSNGVVIRGSNQENGAYPSGLCAERVALFAAGAQYPGISVDAIAITVKSENNDHLSPIVPCGSCRQVMLEYENLHKKSIKVIMHGESEMVYTVDRASSLLPLEFNANHLKK
jgi:cytidine deaminase